MTISAPSERVVNAVTTLIFLGVPAYLEYRAIQELRGQLATTNRTRKVSGHILLAAGLVLFFGLLMLLVVISLLGIRNWSWASPFMFIAMGLVFLGMFLGNQQIGRISKKRLARTGTHGPPTH
jgi:hypothetical protein